MTNDQENKCHTIIHSHAAAAAAGNLVPVPGAGFAVDTIAMTSMCLSLAAVFGGKMDEALAKALAIDAIKKAILKNPIKTVVKEISKIIPGLGQIVAPTLSVAILEAAGWILAKELDEKYSK